MEERRAPSELDYARSHRDERKPDSPHAELAAITIVCGSASLVLQLVLWSGVIETAFPGLLCAALAFCAAIAGTVCGIIGCTRQPLSGFVLAGLLLSCISLVTFTASIMYELNNMHS